jgi:hypothetical protein
MVVFFDDSCIIVYRQFRLVRKKKKETMACWSSRKFANMTFIDGESQVDIHQYTCWTFANNWRKSYWRRSGVSLVEMYSFSANIKMVLRNNFDKLSIFSTDTYITGCRFFLGKDRCTYQIRARLEL